MKYNPLLVTGANGLVGSAIKSLGIPGVVPIGRESYDLLQWAHTAAMMAKYRPEAVIHLAAKVGGVKANMAAPATFFMENMTMNTHVLEAARLNDVKRVICFLSTCVFPDPCWFPLKPEYLHNGPPHPSNYGYAYAKRMLAVQAQTYNEQYGTRYLPVIPCNIYGPNDNFSLENSHVVPALIQKFYVANMTNKPVTIWGSGRPLREFIYSEDVARLLMAILETYGDNEPLILSTGQEHSIRTLVETIATVFNFRGDIIYDKSKPEGQYRKPSDNTRLKELFPDFKFTPLEEGLKRTIQWYCDNYDRARR